MGRLSRGRVKCRSLVGTGVLYLLLLLLLSTCLGQDTEGKGSSDSLSFSAAHSAIVVFSVS